MFKFLVAKLGYQLQIPGRPSTFQVHGSHWDWKSGKNGKAFFSQGNVREFCQDWKSQGILLKILEKLEKIILEKFKRILEKSGKFVSQ